MRQSGSRSRQSGLYRSPIVDGWSAVKTTMRSNEQPLPTRIRLVDFCAGLGGFHHGVERALELAKSVGRLSSKFNVECVAAAELSMPLREAYVRNFASTLGNYSAMAGLEQIDQLRATLPAELAEALPVFDENGVLKAVHGDLSVFLDDEECALRTFPDGTPLLPEHDVLCAGFPCQPFSKSGYQKGFEDTRGTVFHKIATILEHCRPAMLFLENVGNFPRHDGGNTWRRVRSVLENLGYELAATEPRAAGPHATGLLSPHQYGYPHHRERFFLVGQLAGSERDARMTALWDLLSTTDLAQRRPFRPPTTQMERRANMDRAAKQLKRIVASSAKSRPKSIRRAAALSRLQANSIAHWARLIDKLAEHDDVLATTKSPQSAAFFGGNMPSFPIWGYELDPWHWYPIDRNPAELLEQPEALMAHRNLALDAFKEEVWNITKGKTDVRLHPPGGPRSGLDDLTRASNVEKWVDSWPGYAGRRTKWPQWKIKFLRQNREFSIQLWSRLDPLWLRAWLDELYWVSNPDGSQTARPASQQKLEWNAKDAPLDLWGLIAQLRPSGIRVKRPTAVPALVAMTTTQIPLVSTSLTGDTTRKSQPHFRHIFADEALQFQGFPADWHLPKGHEQQFHALGNAVHAGLIGDVFAAWWFDLDPGDRSTTRARQLPLI